jgi:predicted transcriptional regulator
MVMGPGIYEIAKVRYRQELAVLRSSPNAEVYLTPFDLKLGMLVTDTTLHMQMFFSSGEPDMKRDILCRSPGALAWGRELFDWYKGQAKKIEWGYLYDTP